MSRAVADPAMTKDTCGWGGMIGTSAALLAARGFTGLDSEFMLTTDDLALGERWEVLEIYFKHYPCCRWSQPGIDAALRLRPPTRPASRRSWSARSPQPTCCRAAGPRNTEEMQYSLVWPIATALARGCFGVDEVLGGFDDPLVATIAGRIQVEVDPGLTRAFPARRLTELEVVSSDGATVRSGDDRGGGGAPHRRLGGRGGRQGAAVPRPGRRPFRWRCGPSRRPRPCRDARGTSSFGCWRSVSVPRRWITWETPDEQHGGVHAGVPARGDRSRSRPPSAPARREADEHSAFPAENFADLRRLRLVALTAPERLGGHGLWTEGAFTPFYELIEALAWVDTSTAQLLQVHSHALGFLSRHGTPAQHERFLAEIVARGQLLASVGQRDAAERRRSPACTRRSSSPTATGGG